MARIPQESSVASQRILGLITARGGSKRVPRKNVRLVGGKPLLAWTIEAALGSRRLSRVVLSTDDREIAAVGERYGAEAPFLRSAELAKDASAHIDVVLDALDRLEALDGYVADAVCLLQPTSPLRTAEDIDGLVEIALREDVEAMVSVHEATEHPYFVRKIDASGRLAPYIPQDIAYPRKQDLPKAYFVNGAVYFNVTSSLRRKRTFYPEGLRGYEMPPERSLQVDTEHELNIADLLLWQLQGGQPGLKATK